MTGNPGVGKTAGSQWFVLKDSCPDGPYTTEEVVYKLVTNLLSWVQPIWNAGQDHGWRHICDVPAFRKEFPELPPPDTIEEIRKFLASKRVSPQGESALEDNLNLWYLQFEGSEYGPLDANEMVLVLRSGKVKKPVFVWREGLDAWIPLEKVPSLYSVFSEGIRIGQDPATDRRKYPRGSLMATVSFALAGDATDRGNMMTGICRDISLGGMLIISKHVPGYPGALTRLEVTPVNTSEIPPFSAEAEVVRVIPGEKGFSVRFRNLELGIQYALERYLARRLSGHACG